MIDERMRQHRCRLHAEFQPLIQMSAMQHAATYVLILAPNECVVDAIEAAIAATLAFNILAVTMFRALAGRSPQYATLLRVRTAITLEAIGLSAVALFGVTFEHICRTVLRLAGAVFGQITFILGHTACLTGRFGTTCTQITTFTSSTRRVRVQHASVRVAASILTVVGQPTVALFARLHETVAALR